MNRETIELAALGLIEEAGLQALSFRKLSQRLGCEPMSLYHHHASKAHLFDALIDRVLAEMPLPLPGPWRGRLVVAAREFRAIARRRPAFFQHLALHRLNTPGGLRVLDQWLAVFAETGLPPEDAVRMFRVFVSYIVGAALNETSSYSRGPSAVQPQTDGTVARNYPHFAAAGRWFASDQFDATFETGLTMMLDGIEARIPATRLVGE